MTYNSSMLKRVLLAACLLPVVANAGRTVPPHSPCVAGEPGRGGTIYESSRHQNTNFIVHITDINGATISTEPLQGTNVPGGSVATYVQPAGVPGVCDVWNETLLPELPGGGGGGGGIANVYFETFLFDLVQNKYVMYDVFTSMTRMPFTRFPDFYMDLDNNGVADNDGVLYSLINLATFNAFPAFEFGDVSQVVNGRIAGFDISFSTTVPIYDTTNGWTGTPYTGGAVVETDHSFGVVPEPTSLALALVALIAGGVATKRTGQQQAPRSL